jgi:hypothetical protein
MHMKNSFKTMLLLTLVVSAKMLHAQGMKMGEVIMISNSSIRKGVKPEALQRWVNDEIASSWNRKYPGTSMHLFHADRGDGKGKFLLITSTIRAAYREALQREAPLPTTTRLLLRTMSIQEASAIFSVRPMTILNTALSVQRILNHCLLPVSWASII